MKQETKTTTSKMPFTSWAKQGLFYWGAVECSLLIYKFIGAMLVTYEVVESLPYVQLMQY